MNYLFFFVHPSKYYVFKNTINYLLDNNHKVDIMIISKDVLEELVVAEGWNYTNIFPEGRKIKGVSPLISSAINLFRTIYRLFKYAKGKHYDLFITDDLLVFLSKWLHVPSIAFTDDDISITKRFSIILSRANYILAPDITDLGKFNAKKIGFYGYKELAYLHPKIFKPDAEIIKSFNPTFERYFLIRLVLLRSYHDVGMKGLTNSQIQKIISLLESKGKVFISSERPLPKQFKKYVLKMNPAKIAHAIYYADLFIGDSQTMTSEAAILGTPAFRCNDFLGKISVMDEKEKKYGLIFSYLTKDFNIMYQKLIEILSVEKFKVQYAEKCEKMLSEKINLSDFMIWLFENYPKSVEEYRRNPRIQLRFL